MTRVKSDGFWVDDGSGTLFVKVHPRANWQLPTLPAGMTLSVTGVVASYDGSLRLLPRRQNDISPPPGVLPTTGGRLSAERRAIPY
jgi:DNA/RNA endonuclease YhcR with UshA esterase domain